MLTALRSNEVRFLTWSEIEGDLIRIPGDRMKAGREHLVPLSRQAQALLNEMRQTSADAKYVFPGAGADKPLSQNTLIYSLYRMGFHSRQTVHGFRRLFSTILNENGFNRDWIELQLAHSETDAVRGAYNAAQYLPQRSTMMQWWSDFVDQQTSKNKKVEDDFEQLLEAS